MKATDLMIGDLVLVKPSMLPIKVAAIHKDKVGYHAVTHRLNWVRIGLLEPIPLTGEHFERNGFSTLGVDLFTRTVDSLTIRARQEPSGCWFIGVEDRYVTLGIELCVDHVHELQHALRLCGIDKEIEL